MLVIALASAALTGCSYAGVGVADGKAVVARNDAFLFGILRTVYVCQVADGGLANCQDNESP
ncbi:MAG: hypothetical protein AAGN82_15535 [Myxococcota bacterium]